MNDKEKSMQVLENFIADRLADIIMACRSANLPMDTISACIRDSTNDKMVIMVGDDERVAAIVGKEFDIPLNSIPNE